MTFHLTGQSQDMQLYLHVLDMNQGKGSGWRLTAWIHPFHLRPCLEWAGGTRLWHSTNRCHDHSQTFPTMGSATPAHQWRPRKAHTLQSPNNNQSQSQNPLSLWSLTQHTSKEEGKCNNWILTAHRAAVSGGWCHLCSKEMQSEDPFSSFPEDN